MLRNEDQEFYFNFTILPLHDVWHTHPRMFLNKFSAIFFKSFALAISSLLGLLSSFWTSKPRRVSVVGMGLLVYSSIPADNSLFTRRPATNR